MLSSRTKLILSTLLLGGSYAYLRNKYDQYATEQRDQSELLNSITKGNFSSSLITKPNSVSSKRRNASIYKMLYHTLMERLLDKVVFNQYSPFITKHPISDLITNIKPSLSTPSNHPTT